MAELSHGRYITLEEAEKLGVLSAAEGLQRESLDHPWEVVRPVDLPVQQDGNGLSDLSVTNAKESFMAAKNVSLHRALHHLNKGGLHRALGVPEGESIPEDKLESAANSDNPHIKHMAMFAKTLKGFHHDAK